MALDRLAYRVPEFAAAIGVSRAKAYEMVAEGRIPCIRLGADGETGAIRIPVTAVREWIARQLAEQAG